MIPDNNVKVTALHVAAFHDGKLYSVFPNDGPSKYDVHIPGYIFNKAPTRDESVRRFKAMVSDMGYPAPPSFSEEDIFGGRPSGTKIRIPNKTLGSIIETEIFSPQVLYNESPELVRETVESLHPDLEICESDLQDTGMQIIRLDIKMDEEPTFEDSSGICHSQKYRTLDELMHLPMSPTVEYLVTEKKNVFE